MLIARLLVCVGLTAATSACDGLDRDKFRALDNAGQAIAAAVAAKANLDQYRQVLAAFSTELTRTRGEATDPAERALLDEYDRAHSAMTDLRLVWETRQARGSELLPIREELPARIAREYELPVNTNEPPSIYASEALQTIWTAAKTRLDAAHAVLFE
jgi:hypothetical protein